MLTQEIPRNEWSDFFDSFSRQHEGWLVTLEVFDPEIGAQQEACELPLEGITIADRDDSAAIAISAGNTTQNHLTHTVAAPRHVWLETTTQGADAALEIESENERKTLLRFRSALPAEMVDGAVRE